MMESIWTETAQLPAFEPLREDIRTDVLIIGGGLAGLLCAHELSRAGVDYALVEAERICGGMTRNTTAKITVQHGLIYHQLLRFLGEEGAKGYLRANEAALEEYEALCEGLDCDFERRDHIVYAADGRELEKEAAALERVGLRADFLSDVPWPVETAGGLRVRNQAQFHPLKFIREIASGLRIYEHTRVRELIPGGAATSGGNIRADRIIVATHFPLLNKHGSYFLKLYQHRSYVLALEGAQSAEDMAVDASRSGMSFRWWGDDLLLGGGGHRTGKKGGGWEELRAFAARHYPHAREAAHWAAQDCMTLDGVPYIGQYSARTPNLFVTTGFNKWGMTSAMVGAMLLRDRILGQELPWAEVFSPSRSILRPQLAINAAESTLNLLTPTAPRCPHLGCALKYNQQEHSWDCPCHGSRFTEDGRLIDNPAAGDLKRK